MTDFECELILALAHHPRMDDDNATITVEFLHCIRIRPLFLSLDPSNWTLRIKELVQFLSESRCLSIHWFAIQNCLYFLATRC